MSIVHFLLVYDLRAQRLTKSVRFSSADLAAAAYAQEERPHLGDATVEVVLVSADSEETLRRTHGHYFANRRRDASPLPVLNPR